MRDLMFAILLVPLVVMSLRNGFVAYLLWCWAGLVAIQYYLYGFMIGLAYVQLFAVIALLQFLLRKDPERQTFAPNRTTVLLVVFALHITLSAALAFNGHPRTWEMATDMIKTVLLCVLMPLVVTSRYRLHTLVVVVAIAVSFHGVIDGLKFAASAGHHIARGIKKFGDNNHYAMVLVMIIPLLAYLYKHSAVRLVKFSFLALIPLMVFSVVASQSRGGVVALVAVGLWFLLTSRRRFTSTVVMLTFAVVALQLAPDHWLDRMQTLESASEDNSLLGRIGAWQISTAIAIQNPVFGAGPRTIEVGYVWNMFRDAPGLLGFLPMDLNGLPGRGRAAHSIYFEALGDLGFVGLFIFIAILLNAFAAARAVVKICNKVGPRLEWARSLAQMLVLALIAYCSAGALLSATYFDLPYVLFMMLQVLRDLVEKEVKAAATPSSTSVVDTRMLGSEPKVGVHH